MIADLVGVNDSSSDDFVLSTSFLNNFQSSLELAMTNFLDGLPAKVRVTS